jgi:hypothetical protein
MRLLHAQKINLTSFEENAIPPYAILSHTWGADEVSFQDIHDLRVASKKAGYKKIEYVCRDALWRDLEYVWIDTCCIDKTSSAELSEAINSMFRWYRNATYCYAYLTDVPCWTENCDYSDFSESRWFTRGWTLQELLAPERLYFFSFDGVSFGSKHSLSEQISKITGIGEPFLTGVNTLSQASIAKRMSWASRRNTTRTEDLAYCLLGIFGINMPLLYGEAEKAFTRLQEEIMKNSDDQSLFAWGYSGLQRPDADPVERVGPFAKEPAAFRESGTFVPDELEPSSAAHSLTNKGLQINFRLMKTTPVQWAAVLTCRPEQEFLWLVAIPIDFYSHDSFMRVGSNRCLLVKRDKIGDDSSKHLRFLTSPLTSHVDLSCIPSIAQVTFFIRRSIRYNGLFVREVEPGDVWDRYQRLIQLHWDDYRHIVIHLWHAKMGGYAIVLNRNNSTPLQWSYLVFRETSDQPLNYDSFSGDSLRSPYDIGLSQDIKVDIGEDMIRMASGIVIRTIDIQAANIP